MSTTITVGTHGYVVLVDLEAASTFVLHSDRRGVHDVANGAITFAEAGGEEKAITAAVLMAWRLDRTKEEEVRLALSWAEKAEVSGR